MNELYEKTKEFILENYNGELSDEVLDILTVATIAISGRFSEISIKKLPSVFNKIIIDFSDGNIIDMVMKRYPEYPKEELNKGDSTFVTRALGLNDDNQFDEEWAMFISTTNISNNLVNLIGRITHELIHLLRFNGIIEGPTEAKIKDGISIARCNKETKTVKRKHYNLEEGIVESFTIKALDNLYELISSCDVSFSPAFSAIKKSYKTKFKPGYQIECFFLDGLTRDKHFNELLEYSFLDESEPLSVITYYNDKVGNAAAFTRLSRGIDKVLECAHNDDKEGFAAMTEGLIEQIGGFLEKKMS